MTSRTVANLISILLMLVSLDVAAGEAGADRRQVQVQAQIHPDLPPYLFFLASDAVFVSSDYRDTRQTLKAEGEFPADPAFLFLLHDINFDGYLDFATIERGGAKWGHHHYRVFDPESGQFVTNWLTAELGRLSVNRMYPDGNSKEIYVEHLVVGSGRFADHYQIQGDRLVLVETKDQVFNLDREARYFVTNKLIDGEMKVIETESQ